MKVSLDRKDRLEVNAFELTLAAMGIIAALSAVFAPPPGTVADFKEVAGVIVAAMWALMLGGGGLAIILGVWFFHRGTEAAGVIMYLAAILMQTVILALAAGDFSFSAMILRLVVLVGFATKLKVILKGEYITILKPEPDDG